MSPLVQRKSDLKRQVTS